MLVTRAFLRYMLAQKHWQFACPLNAALALKGNNLATTNEGRVYFALDGDDFEPDQLTEFLGMTPTSIMRKGSKIHQVNAQ